MRAIGYARVSTERQADFGVSLEAQSEKVRAMAVVQGAELVDVIVDAGESAKSLNRPGMERLLSLVDSAAVDCVIIAKLDRLTRILVARLLIEFATLLHQTPAIRGRGRQRHLLTRSFRVEHHELAHARRSHCYEDTATELRFSHLDDLLDGAGVLRNIDAIDGFDVVVCHLFVRLHAGDHFSESNAGPNSSPYHRAPGPAGLQPDHGSPARTFRDSLAGTAITTHKPVLGKRHAAHLQPSTSRTIDSVDVALGVFRWVIFSAVIGAIRQYAPAATM